MHRQSIFIAALLVCLASIVATHASAAEEKWCYQQYNVFQQSVIDRRALGGDLPALLARAQCSWPLTERGEKPIQNPTPSVVIEGYFWSALAYCRGEDPEELPGGTITRASQWRWQSEIKGLKLRFESARSELNSRGAKFRQQSFDEYQRRLAALGPAGLIELGRTSACAIDADEATTAGTWLAAYQAWIGLETQLGSTTGTSTLPPPPSQTEKCTVDAAVGTPAKPWVWKRHGKKDELDPCVKYKDVADHLSLSDQERARNIAASLLQGLSENVTKLREGAAIARISQLDVEDIHWALYALGAYKDAIDKDYDPKTLAAVKRAQTELNLPTHDGDGPPDGWLVNKSRNDGWLTHQEARAVICKASLKPSETRAIALGYLAVMYAKGIGFPENLLKARAILNFALPQINDLINTTGIDPAKNIKLKALKKVLEGSSQEINQQIANSGLSTANAAPFESNWQFLCPSILEPND